MPPITVMIKPVSGACNMRCRYCFYADEMKRREVAISPRMSDALLDVTVRRVIRSADSAVHFLFQGGEPTLIGLPFFERLVQLEQKYNTRALRITNAVQTNGYDLSDEMIAFFAKEHFLVGVSLDGTAQTHDLMRPDAAGRPTASVVRKTIERLREAGVSVNVLCVVNGEVAKRPSEVFDALAPYEYIQFIPCLDGLDGQTRDYSLSGEAYLAFLKETFDRYHLAYTEGHPVSIRNFCERIGVSKVASTVDYSFLEHCLREDLNLHAQRAMAVLHPVKLRITNYPEGQSETFAIENNPEDENAGTRDVTFSNELWIEADDFMEEPTKKYNRLYPGNEVRIKGAYIVRCTGCVKDADGNVTEVLCEYDPASRGGDPADGRKVRGTIHWVDAHNCADAEVRLYDNLFADADPEGDGKDYLECLNPDSLSVLTGCKVERMLAGAEAPAAFQFLRLGYFAVDNKDSTPEHLVFNRAVALKDSFKKA